MKISVTDLAATVAEQQGVNKSEAEKTVRATFDAIAGNLAVGREVNIPGFGKFVTKDVAARMARNPATGGQVEVAASTKVSFKPAKQLKEAL